MSMYALDLPNRVIPSHPGSATATTPAGPSQEFGAKTTDTTATNIGGWGEAQINDNTFVAYIVGWGIFLLILALFNRTRWGHSLIYYGLVLTLMLLLFGNYQAIGLLLQPVTAGANGPVEEPGSPEQAPAPGGAPGPEQGAPEQAPSSVRAGAPRFSISGA